MKELSTDLSREAFELKSDQSFAKTFYKGFWMSVFIGFSFSLGLILAVLNADIIDSFMNTKAGVFTAVAILGAIATTWIVWRINKMS